MYVRELDAVERLLRRLLRSYGSESVHSRRLNKLLREVAGLRRGGKLPPRRLARIVALIAETVLDEELRRIERR
jgi:anti-sigma factor RsiW